MIVYLVINFTARPMYSNFNIEECCSEEPPATLHKYHNTHRIGEKDCGENANKKEPDD